MNQISKNDLHTLGYNFVDNKYLPEGKDEYHLRNHQNRSGIHYRQLNAQEIEILVRNRNQSDDWNNILVSDDFNPELVKNCKLYGLIRIGKLENCYREYHDIRMPVGLYNSTIISCDFGDNVVVDNVNYLSHYIIGNDAIIVNINEMVVTNFAKFGNGILKEGEDEKIRIWLELCNENGGRSVIPFNGMQPGDAYLWSNYRADKKLLQRFLEFTEKRFDKQRGYYGKVGDRSIIKNCSIIKDVWVGSDAYIKGANKLKNLTINSQPNARTQIGEGCELVNGIIESGCRIFYGVKAVRFIMASHSQLKYGARLINSFLGNNATISCCEVLNSLIYPSHEQHHNNSFLCAALIMGQSNIAAGATIGSNHNSRGADGEIIAGRGFWPGLCVSLKHNSRFASFAIVAKGDYQYEVDIKVPFALISNDLYNNRLVVMPGYWFMYNMYALARNAWKYKDRDKRIDKIQHLEFDYLAPDSVQEMKDALVVLELAAGMAYLKQVKQVTAPEEKAAQTAGRKLLEQKDAVINELFITVDGWENASRPTELIKVQQSWDLFRKMIAYYAINNLREAVEAAKIKTVAGMLRLFPERFKKWEWKNIGGQLVTHTAIKGLFAGIKQHTINSWEEVHGIYRQEAAVYNELKLVHSLQLLMEVHKVRKAAIDKAVLKSWSEDALKTRDWISENIYNSREKDYSNPFRNMVYESEEERDNVLGKLSENSFLIMEKEELKKYKRNMKKFIGMF